MSILRNVESSHKSAQISFLSSRASLTICMVAVNLWWMVSSVPQTSCWLARSLLSLVMVMLARALFVPSKPSVLVSLSQKSILSMLYRLPWKVCFSTRISWFTVSTRSPRTPQHWTPLFKHLYQYLARHCISWWQKVHYLLTFHNEPTLSWNLSFFSMDPIYIFKVGG